QRVGGAGLADGRDRRAQESQLRSFGFSYRRQRRVGDRLCRRPRREQRQGRRPRRDSLGVWDRNSPAVRTGDDPMYDPSFKIWGYETNWGSFAQFARVQAHQCMPKATHLTWEEAAGPTLVGATAFRMLMGWAPHVVRRGDVVLIWGASGGLGCMAIQIVKAEGGIPVGVVGDDRKIDYCIK